jgi:hypothetical protein
MEGHGKVSRAPLLCSLTGSAVTEARCGATPPRYVSVYTLPTSTVTSDCDMFAVGGIATAVMLRKDVEEQRQPSW